MPLSTCGVAALAPPAQAWASLRQAGAAAAWPPLPGGEYRLCWCSSHSPAKLRDAMAGNASGTPCASGAAFVVDFGSLLVRGPRSADAAGTCVAGHTCAIHGLLGAGLSTADSVVALDTCGLAAAVPRLPPASILKVSAESGRVAWSDALTSAGGEYRLCWCGSDGSLAACSSPAAFAIDAGYVAVLGPSPLEQSGTCIAGLTPAPHRPGYRVDGGWSSPEGGSST